MRKLLRDLTPGQDYLMQFRTNDGTNVSQWSQAYRFRTNGDVTAPMDVSNFEWKPTGESFLATWTAPTLDANNKPLRDLSHYELTVEANGQTKVFKTTSTSWDFNLVMNAATFGAIELEVKLTVKAVDLTGNKSNGVTKTAVEDTPPTPSTPTTSIVSGQLALEWSGTTVLGTISPFNLQYVKIHASQTNNFTPTDATLVGRFEGWVKGKQSTIIPGLTYGTKYYFKLVSVNKKGKESPPSGQAEGTPTRISGLDIQNGTISVDQINFVDQLGGGSKAYYTTTAPTTTSHPGLKDGDIWFDKDDAYKPYKRVSDSWVADPDIGMVSGTRIVAGTVTADQIGTNKIITSSANIGTAVIDAANIGSVDAGTITAGTMQSKSMVSYGGGTPRPAWSLSLTGDAQLNSVNVRGDLVIGNSGDAAAVRAASVVRSYDYIANTAGWAIKGDGTVEFNNGLFRGTVKTATTGRRIEMGVTGAIGDIKFFGASGTQSAAVRGWSGNNGGEVLRMETTVANSTWRAFFQLEDGDATHSIANQVYETIGRQGGSTGLYVVQEQLTTSQEGLPTDNRDRLLIEAGKGTFWLWDSTGNRARLIMDNDGWFFRDGAAKTRFIIYPTNTQFLDSSQNVRFQVADSGINVWDPNGVNRLGLAGQHFYVYDQGGGIVLWHDHSALEWTINPAGDNAGNWGNFKIINNGQFVQQSPKIRLMAPNGFGGVIKWWATDIEIRDWGDTGWAGVKAYAFRTQGGTVNNRFFGDLQGNVFPPSDEAFKTDITTFGAGALEKIKKTRVTKYNRKSNPGVKEIGLLANEAPPEIVVDLDDSSEGLKGISLYGMTSLNWAGLQEAAVEIDSLKSELAKLKAQVAELTRKNGAK